MGQASKLPGKPTPRRVSTTDRDELRRWIPAGYRPVVHLGGMFGLGLGAVILLVLRFAEQIRAADLLAVPITFAVGTLLEYLAHRFLMHVRWRALQMPWEAHTGRHHHYYLERSPTWERPADVWLLLFSPSDVLVLVAVVAGPFAILWRSLAEGAWALSLASSILFFLGYEALHLAYHLPDGHPVTKVPWLRAMRRHHLRHHRLAGMNVNYGVTNRVWDRVVGTEERSTESSIG